MTRYIRYPPESYVRYLNTPTVQAAIGAFVNYTEQSVAVATAFNKTGDDGRLDGTTAAVLLLVEQGVVVCTLSKSYDSRKSLTHSIIGHNGIRRCGLQQCVIPISSVCNNISTEQTDQPKQKKGNWLGGEAVYNSISVPGYPTPGYVDISTADLIVHGQAKQSGIFTFARIYDSGHEVPYYQPLTALAIFKRAINGYDIATGQTQVSRYYITAGPTESTYREGNSTVLFELTESGRQEVVNASTYDDVVEGESAPSRQLLAELEALAHANKGKVKVGNGTVYGGVLEGEKEKGEQKDPIHLRKREGKMRGGGFLRDERQGVDSDGFIRTGLRDLGV